MSVMSADNYNVGKVERERYRCHMPNDNDGVKKSKEVKQTKKILSIK